MEVKALKSKGFLLFIFFLQLSLYSFSQKSIEKGFEALTNKNYGLANNYFRAGLKKSKALACFGLSKLYVTQDYRQLDSAYHFILLADGCWSNVDVKTRAKWKSAFMVDSLSIQQHKQAVSQLIFEQIKSKPTVALWNSFILQNNWYHSMNTAVYLRDQLAFEQAKEKGLSLSLKSYIDTLPESSFVQEAQHLFYDLQFQEYTKDGDVSSFVRFFEECPDNSHHMEAAQQIYDLSTRHHSLEEYSDFVRNFQSNPFVNEAWRNVYKIYLKDYSEDKYHAFQKEFPDYPFMHELAVDIDLFQMKLYPVISGGLYGFMNGQGNLMIPALYNEVGPFQEGLAVVSKDDKFGIIDKRNQVIVDFQYDEILEFLKNRAVVRKGEQYGVIDRLGKLVFPLIYEDINVRNDGLYEVVQKGEMHYFDSNYSPQFAVSGVITKSFAERISMQHPDYEFIGELDASSNRAVVKINGQLNYIDSSAKLILSTPLEWFADALSVAKFKNGYAVFRKKGKFGLIDVTGKVVQKPVYEASGPFTEFWPVKDKGNWALLDVKGKVILPFEYDFIRYFPEMGYLVEREGFFGLVNDAGKMVLPVSFSNIKPFEQQYFYLSIEDKQGLFTRDGKEVLAIQYDRIQRFDSESFVLQEGGKMKYYFPNTHSFLSLIE